MQQSLFNLLDPVKPQPQMQGPTEGAQTALYSESAAPEQAAFQAADQATGQPTSGSSLAYSVHSPIKGIRFTVLDLETTGLQPKKNAITEMTAIQYEWDVLGKGRQVNKVSSLVKPTETISPEIERFTGITNEMVANAPSLSSVMNQLSELMGPSPVIVGHNIKFDINFLKEKFQEVGLVFQLNQLNLDQALCTKVLAQKLLPNLPSYEGVVVATQCGVFNPNPHRAEADVVMAADILFCLLERYAAQAGVSLDDVTLGDLVAFQGPL